MCLIIYYVLGFIVGVGDIVMDKIVVEFRGVLILGGKVEDK